MRERFTQSNQLLQKTSVRLADFEARNASLTKRLRKHLLEMKRLLRLLDQINDAAGRLRRSRRWKLANPFSAIVGNCHRKPLPGFGHLDKNVEKYRLWRGNHPEMAKSPRKSWLSAGMRIGPASAAEKKPPMPAGPVYQPPAAQTRLLAFPRMTM